MAVEQVMIQKLAEQAFTALMNQAQYAIDFKSQLQALKTQLDLMTAFLADTDNLKIKKETLKQSLIKLRELLYEADDILTDCMIRDEYKKPGYTCSTFSPNALFFKFQTGQKLKDLNSRMERMEKSLNTYLTPQQLLNLGDNTYRARIFTSQDFDPSEIIGLEDDVEKLRRWIFSSGGVLQRIGIVGMGGLGKTTIAQKIFDDKEVIGCFEKRIWVSVSQDFNEERIIRSILEQLEQSVSGSDLSQIMHKLNQSLQGQNCLIVMDDVWGFNPDWWSKLCSALQKQTGKRSCVIITTRNEEMASRMGVENSQIHWPKVLNEKESWSLFCNFAFSATKGVCPNQPFEKVGKDIVGKCGGLPLAIKTIAALLAPKAHNLGEWKDIHDHFHELTTREENSSVKASLQLSYDALPTHLKQFLLCFAICPEDFMIQAEQLVHWWVGEGFIQGTDSKTATELGYNSLLELVRRCLVEVVERRGYDGRVYSCKMHDLVRDLTTTIAEDEMFCKFQTGKQKLTPESRWLGLTSEMSTISLKHCSKLRALLRMSSNEGEFPFNKNHMVPLDSLRVLDLSHVKLDKASMENLWNWIVLLERLAYLNLSGATGLEKVPSSIQKLRNLHLLILTGCSNLIKVHSSITYLKMLVVLDLGSCGHQFLPQGLGMLNQLQELSGFRLVRQANTQSCRLLELQKLLQLRVLRMNLSDQSEIAENEWEVLSKLEKLKVLSINTEDCKDRSILELLNRLYPPPNLQELYLRRYRHQVLPEWINSTRLSTLRYLCIENGDIGSINSSPDSDREGSGSNWNYLEGLCLKFLPNLEEDWKNLQETMHSLRYVEVSHCFNLKNFPCSTHKPGIWKKTED